MYDIGGGMGYLVFIKLPWKSQLTDYLNLLLLFLFLNSITKIGSDLQTGLTLVAISFLTDPTYGFRKPEYQNHQKSHRLSLRAWKLLYNETYSAFKLYIAMAKLNNSLLKNS